jgi:hypothetical protein
MTQRSASGHELKQLSKLRQLRVRAALEHHSSCTRYLNAAQVKVVIRATKIADIRNSISKLSNYMVGVGCVRLPKEATYAIAQREVLDDQLERNAYALLGEQQALEECEQQLQEAKNAWIKAIGREEAVKKLQTKFQHQLMINEYRYSELINEERTALYGHMNAQPNARRVI